jgi:hypothetical protein
MHVSELFRDPLVILTRAVNGDGQEECLVGCDQVRPVNRELPFEAEVPLDAIVRVLREHRDKQDTRLDLLADRLVPDIPAPERTLIKPDFDSRRAQCLANPLSRLGIL